MAAPRLKLPAVTAAILLLGAACRRAPEAPPAPTPDLAAPAPSSSFVTTPLDGAATGYTNEMQAAALSKETAELGIADIGRERRPDEPAIQAPVQAPVVTEEDKKQRAIDRKERLRKAKELRLEYTKIRRDMDAARDRSVALTGTTAAMIPGRESGSVIGVVEDAPGVWSGAYGGAVENGDRVVEDAAAWAELWGRLSRETPPAVDFAKTRVAAIFAGQRPTPGYRARLIDAVRDEERWLVRWYEEGPAPDEKPGEGATAPFLLVTVPKDDKPVRLEKVRRSIGPKRK